MHTKNNLDPADFINTASMFNTNMRPNATANYPGRTYRFYTGNAIYSFGDGLSYTTFSYSMTSAGADVAFDRISRYVENSAGQFLRTEAPVLQWVTIKVKNTGTVAGSDVVLLFVQNPTPGVGGAPIKTLMGFERVYLEPGESIDVPFSITAHDLTLANGDGGRGGQRGTWTLLAGQPTKATTTIHVL